MMYLAAFLLLFAAPSWFCWTSFAEKVVVAEAQELQDGKFRQPLPRSSKVSCVGSELLRTFTHKLNTHFGY